MNWIVLEREVLQKNPFSNMIRCIIAFKYRGNRGCPILKVSLQKTIYRLHDRGRTRRRIARELGIDREIVGRYLRLAKNR
jgi:hypothetical protein